MSPSSALAHSLRVHVKREPDGWILTEIAAHLGDRLGWTVSNTTNPRADINYFVNYHRYEDVSGLTAAFFTHREHWYGRYEKMWWEVLAEVDLAVFQSKKYQLESQSRIPTLNSVVVSPGFDPSRFSPRRIRIGVIGRSYNNGRKGEDLLIEVARRFPAVDWVVTGANWGLKSKRVRSRALPDLYRSLDYLLIPSRTEGGPMSAIEALASGVPVISADVGWMSELPHLEFENGNVESLAEVITGIMENRASLVGSVENRTWAAFATEHLRAFEALIGSQRR